MRSHHFQVFAITTIKRVFCSCRLPDSGDEMIKFEGWFHYTCIGLNLAWIKSSGGGQAAYPCN